MSVDLLKPVERDRSPSQTERPVRRDCRIDTHHHILPPSYAIWLESRGVTDGGRPFPKWSIEAAVDLMGDNDIDASILSVSTPGVCLGDDVGAIEMAREVNEFAADIVRRDSTRFGFFATLPLPDIDRALAEASYAFDALGADGVILLSNIRGVYVGDPSFEPLMAYLNRRKAVILIHPCDPPTPGVPGIPSYAADFLLDTTRAAINIAKSGCLERHPDLKIILSHAGGFVPYAAERFAGLCSPDGGSAGGIERLRRFYFDTALSSTPYALPSLLSFAEPTHITFGSDWPFAPKERSIYYRRLLDDFPLTDAQRQAIARGNAAKLFPRFG